MLPLYGVPWLQGYGEYTEESDHAVAESPEGIPGSGERP